MSYHEKLTDVMMSDVSCPHSSKAASWQQFLAPGSPGTSLGR